MKIGRNEPCPCGSGKKYKKCCLNNITPFKQRESKITKDIPDYGTPKIEDNFFDNKFEEEANAASLLYFQMSEEGFDRIINAVVSDILPKERKKKIKMQEKMINGADNPDQLIDMLYEKIEGDNEALLVQKILEHPNYIIPKIIERLQENTNEFFVEFSIKILNETENETYAKMLTDRLHLIKDPHTLSCVCLVLGFIGGTEAIKPLWDIYHFFKEMYPDKTLDQGPLFALHEVKERGLL